MSTGIPTEPEKQELAFITSNPLHKLDRSSRKLVRSHVMRGKNRRKKAAEATIVRSWINQGSTNGDDTTLISSFPAGQHVPPPIQIWSDLPMTHFAYQMPSYAPELLFNFFTVIGQAVYPIELCVVDLQNSIWIEYLAQDQLYCHMTLWVAQAYFDSIRGHGISTIQSRHGQETLVKLQQRLPDTQLAISNVTILVVGCLAVATALVEIEKETACRHMLGLNRMVQLRGGITAFRGNPHVQLKICRADLITAMLLGNKPKFFNDDISWDSFITKKHMNIQEMPPGQVLCLHPKLTNVWNDLREFTKSANLATQTGQKIPFGLYYETLISVQYRLLLFGNETGAHGDAIHAGMLGFATSIFLQMKGFSMRFERLSSQLKKTILGMNDTTVDSSMAVKLWLLFIARLVISQGGDDFWLETEMRNTIKTLELHCWPSAKHRLMGFLWIGFLHDDSGKKVFEDILR
ncbi:hypothetical protein BJ875DRAFT_240503 [Amylocarpus encephaloides]|uniref:Transcription factor domain-containing protein n=1 Tax=Amylocarpus encephaloides TaxID=45428 RepID=A0A9P8BZI7_9HELO|nr:hypothetical protein BJ875DRAFT_240503 [Amylocarpus encephaloides]